MFTLKIVFSIQCSSAVSNQLVFVKRLFWQSGHAFLAVAVMERDCSYGPSIETKKVAVSGGSTVSSVLSFQPCILPYRGVFT